MRDEDFQALIAGLRDTGMSRSQIARDTRLSRQTLWRLEAGRTISAPSYDTVRRIEDFATRQLKTRSR
jgi:transcriptional regulator with XRE-family HTH domain